VFFGAELHAMITRIVAAIAFLILMLISPIASAVTIINCQPCTQVSTTNVSCPKPTGLTVGQLLLTVVGQTGNNNFTPPSGWTNPQGGTNGICGQSISNGPSFVYWAYKKATSTEVAASSFVWTAASGFGGGGGICAYDFVGYNAGNPLEGAGVSCNSNGFSPSTTLTATSITTAVNNSQVIVAYDSSLQSGASTITGPGGATQRVEYHGGSWNNFWMGDFTKTTAGATGNQSGTQTQNVQYNAIMFAILTGPSAAGAAGGNVIWPFP
jgi:hypothetical protein